MDILLEFSSKSNIELLWEILLDELNIKTNNNLIQNIRNIFEANIKPFITRANPKKTLINLNKEFLSQVIIAVNKLIPNLKQEQNIKKLNISNEEFNIPYKIEDIQASRQNDFDKQLTLKQTEFNNLLNPPKPKELDFSIKEKETKITEMEKLISETITRRNYDIEQINLITNNSTDKQQKKVTWDENLTSFSDENITLDINETNNNFYNKLKYVNDANNDSIQTQVNNDSIKTQIANINNELTNINKKFDTLYEMISNLINISQIKPNITETQ